MCQAAITIRSESYEGALDLFTKIRHVIENTIKCRLILHRVMSGANESALDLVLNIRLFTGKTIDHTE
jgi:hypothetical protein